MNRLPGWEMRLAAVIEAARHQRYELGTWDCFTVACRAVQALTGVDLWGPWAGTYRTPEQALRRIVEYGGSFDAAFSKLFGAEPVSPLLAHQGDILKYVGADGTPHLGVCVGPAVMLTAPDGVRPVDLLACALAWRIG